MVIIQEHRKHNVSVSQDWVIPEWIRLWPPGSTIPEHYD